MAYDRSKISRDIAEVEQKLRMGEREAPAGEVIDAVVKSGICGRGVAQQILSELRKNRNTEGSVAPVVEPEMLSNAIEDLLRPFDEINRVVNQVKGTIGRAAEVSMEEVRASCGAIIADQGINLKRTAEDGRIQIEILEGSLVEAQNLAADAAAKLLQADAERADLFARMTDAQEAYDALCARVVMVEQERDHHKNAAEMLRLDLDALRHDLSTARKTEEGLRDRLNAAAADQVDSVEYAALKVRLETLMVSLTDERTRNVELHAQVVQLVGAVLHLDIGTAPAPASPG